MASGQKGQKAKYVRPPLPSAEEQEYEEIFGTQRTVNTQPSGIDTAGRAGPVLPTRQKRAKSAIPRHPPVPAFYPQAAPNADPAQQHSSDDEEGPPDSPGVQEPAAAPAQGAQDKTRTEAAQREAAQFAAWADARPVHQGDLFRNGPLHALRQRRLIEARRAELAGLMSDPCHWQEHCCGAGQGKEPAWKELPARCAVHFGLTSRFSMPVPRRQCLHCKAAVEPRPTMVGCWGATPTYPHWWFDIEDMEMYHYLKVKKGVSVTGTRRRVCQCTHTHTHKHTQAHRHKHTHTHTHRHIRHTHTHTH